MVLHVIRADILLIDLIAYHATRKISARIIWKTIDLRHIRSGTSVVEHFKLGNPW